MARRRHRHRITIIPPTTSKTIVFPYKSGSFDMSHYTPFMTQHRLSIEEVHQYLKEIEEQMRKNNSFAPKCVLILGILFFVLAVFSIGAVVPLVSIKHPEKAFVIFPIVFPVLIVAIIVLVCTILCYSTKQFRVWEQNKKQVKEYINKTKEGFQGKNVGWVVPFNFPKWIELWTNISSEDYQFNQMLENEINWADLQKKQYYNNNNMYVDSKAGIQMTMVYQNHIVYQQQNMATQPGTMGFVGNFDPEKVEFDA